MDYNSAIFVFGSNEGGFHGAGAARFAYNYKGAILYQASGLQGQAYAIPTKDKTIRHTLSLEEIGNYVNDFILFATAHPEMEFQVTRLGCGLAGFQDHEMAPLFMLAPTNCWFDDAWKPWLGNGFKYWGHK